MFFVSDIWSTVGGGGFLNTAAVANKPDEMVSFDLHATVYTRGINTHQWGGAIVLNVVLIRQYPPSCQARGQFLKGTRVGISLTCVIVVVKVVFEYDYSIWCFLSVVSESRWVQKGLWFGRLGHCG